MKSIEINNWYKPTSIVFHLKIIGIIILCLIPILYKSKLPLLSALNFQIIILAIFVIETWCFLAFKLFKYKEGKSHKEVTRNTLIRFVLLYVSCMLSVVIIQIFYQVIMYTLHGSFFLPYISTIIRHSFAYLQSLNFPILVILVVVLFNQWQYALKKLYKLNEEKLIFQNETLKNQVNPHFLFNSLNTLLSLVNTNPEKTEQFIIKLSSIYRYIIENSPKDKVSLALEMAFINDFFYLHKIRDEEKIQLEVKISDADKYEIMPVSLQLLIENALKHNMATRESPLNIKVYIENNYIVVTNNLQKMASKPESSQTGLKNLNQRVLLTAGKALIIKETANEYIVKLPLMQ